VWRQFDLAKLPDTHVLPDEYETTLEELVRLTCPRLKGLVLMTPFFVEPNRSEPMRQRMDEYGAIVRKVAERNGTLFVDTQAAFDAYLAKSHSATLAGDRVHPNPAGHMILARAFLRAIDFEA
jgi:lysophospholipase L1-like esterase